MKFLTILLALALVACGGSKKNSAALPPTLTPHTIKTLTPPHVGAGVGPAVVQTASAGTVGNGTSLTVTPTSAVTGGNELFAFIGTGDTNSVITAPPGWVMATDSAATACREFDFTANQGAVVYMHRAASGETGSYTFTFSVASGNAVMLVEVSNVSATTPIDKCAKAEPPMNGSTGFVAAAPLTASGANELPMVIYDPSTSGLGVTRSAGWSGALYNNTQTPYNRSTWSGGRRPPQAAQ
jgi:hypothetical protein